MIDRFAGSIWDERLPFPRSNREPWDESGGDIPTFPNWIEKQRWNDIWNGVDPGSDPKYPDVNKIDPYFGSRGWQIIPTNYELGIPSKAIGPDGQVYL